MCGTIERAAILPQKHVMVRVFPNLVTRTESSRLGRRVAGSGRVTVRCCSDAKGTTGFHVVAVGGAMLVSQYSPTACRRQAAGRTTVQALGRSDSVEGRVTRSANPLCRWMPWKHDACSPLVGTSSERITFSQTTRTLGFTHFVKDLTNTIRFGVLCEIAQSERVAHRADSDDILSVLLKSVGFHNLGP